MPTALEPELTHLLTTTLDLVFIAQEDGLLREVNPAVLRKLEYSWDELKLMPVSTLIHPDDWERTKSRRLELFKGKPLLNFRNRYISKTGNIIWLDWTSVYLPDHKLVFAIARDVTQGQRTEDEMIADNLRFRALASHFKGRLEQDRQQMANHLHEQLAQISASIKLDLDWVASSLNEASPDIRNRVQHVLKSSQLLINTIRTMSQGISTSMVADLGLRASLQWLCEDLGNQSALDISFNARTDTEDLPAGLQIDIYRMAQDVLRSFHLHCNKGTAQMNLAIHDREIELRFIFNHCDLGLMKETSLLEHLQNMASMINAQVEANLFTNLESSICVRVRY